MILLRKILPVFVLGLAALLLPGGAARAQSAASAGAAFRTESAAKPIVLRVTETGPRKSVADWTWDRQNKRFEGRWNNGSRGHIRLKELDKNKVVFTRVDPAGRTAGLKARYVGTFQGKTIKGTVHWTYKGQTARGTWSGYALGNNGTGERRGVSPPMHRKARLNKARFPDERHALHTPAQRRAFPLLRDNFEVLARSTPRYNCIAHSLGIHGRWVNPVTGPSSHPLAGMDQMYQARGYVRLRQLDYRLEPGKQKVVVYAMLRPDKRIKAVTHAALQAADGTWTSKLGKLALIRHLTPQALNGPVYGRPVAVYVRNRS
jgi:hypothetical protein